jgi:hypothetical protein
MIRHILLWLAACLVVHLANPAGADQPPTLGGETATPAGAEAKSLGVDHYEVSFIESKPHIKIFGSERTLLGVLDVDWGTTPDEGILNFQRADGRSLLIHWKPASGLFEVSEPDGEEAKRVFRDGKWVGDPDSDRLIEENKDAIALAAVATSDYLVNTGQIGPKPRHGGAPGPKRDPGH